jgi:biofilm PGA synthesis lipoprotein PgaB
MVFRSQKRCLHILATVLAVSGTLFIRPAHIGILDPQKERAEASVYREPFSPETGVETCTKKELKNFPKKRESSFTRRMLAAQILLFGCQDYADVETCIKKLKRAGVNTLIVRAFQNRGDAPYRFSRPRCSEGVYFQTEHAPVVAPLLPRLVSIGHRHGLKVFAWMETRRMPLRHPDPERARAIGYSFETDTLEPLEIWSIFDEVVQRKLVDLYEDAVRCGIDGILIQDDLVMRHCEDFSPKAVALFEKETGKVLEPHALYQDPFKDPYGRWCVSRYTDTFWEWSRWKNEKLLKIASKLIKASRTANPQIEFAMNFMYESVTDPKNALAWLSQSLVESTKLPIDFYAIMAYHRQIKSELNLTDEGTYEKISDMTANALKLINDPNKILMKVQLKDWNTGRQIPAVEADEVLRRINAKGRVSLAFIPYSAQARLDVIQHHLQ